MEFLQVECQSKLRAYAQERSEKYEDALKNYKKIFLAHFELVKKNFETSENCKNCKSRNICNEIYDEIKEVEKEEITDFFTRIEQVYIAWINSKTEEAIGKYKELLNFFKLMQFEKKINDYEIYFKARVTDEVLTTYDMFHIPFNKRYLIKNQRFSLTGQPMLYVGSSIIDLAEELEVESINNMKVSAIMFPNNKLKIYDLRTDIMEALSANTTNNLLEQKDKNINLKTYFFKFMLASVCSFKKRKELDGFYFCEEYVLPQLLAQILKNEKYNGIAYYSTKKFENVFCEEINKDLEKIKEMKYKENIAVFTELSQDHVYDKILYDDIDISVPIDINKITNITLDDIKEVKNEIDQYNDYETKIFAEMLFKTFDSLYARIKIGETDYYDTQYGKLHIYELYMILNHKLIGEAN